jgi:hypothetical protein
MDWRLPVRLRTFEGQRRTPSNNMVRLPGIFIVCDQRVALWTKLAKVVLIENQYDGSVTVSPRYSPARGKVV